MAHRENKQEEKSKPKREGGRENQEEREGIVQARRHRMGHAEIKVKSPKAKGKEKQVNLS